MFELKNEERIGCGGPEAGINTLRQIEKGRTSERRVRTALSEPSREHKSEEGTKLLVYNRGETRRGIFSMPFLTIEDDKQQYKRLVVEIETG